jgi:parvulin-like peptidyl-prolyl isomerase
LGPEKTQYGYHVLEVLEFFPQGSYQGLDEVYDEISQNIYRSKRAKLYGLLLDSLRNVYPPNADVGGAQKPR